MPSLFDLDRVTTSLADESKESVLRTLASLFSDLDTDVVHRVFLNREALASTGLGSGVAVPHGRVSGVSRVHAALGVHRDGVAFDAIDGEPVHIFVALVSPLGRGNEHLRALAEVSRILRPDAVRKELLQATPEQALALLT